MTNGMNQKLLPSYVIHVFPTVFVVVFYCLLKGFFKFA
jgi:hypothetical protein